MSISDRLKAERERLGMSVVDFAAAAGVGRNTFLAWTAGRSNPPADRIAALSDAGVDVTYILTGVRSARLPGTTEQERQEIDTLIGIYLYSGDEDRIRLMAYAGGIHDAGVRAGRVRYQVKRPTKPAEGAESPASTSDETQS